MFADGSTFAGIYRTRWRIWSIKVHKDPLVIKAQLEIKGATGDKGPTGDKRTNGKSRVQLDLKDHKDIWEL